MKNLSAKIFLFPLKLKKAETLLRLALLIGTCLIGFMACSEDDQPDDPTSNLLKIAGTWQTSDAATTYTISDSVGELILVDNPEDYNWDYKTEIISYNNEEFTVVVEIVEHTQADQIGKFTMCRWKNLTPNAVDFVEGFPQVDNAEAAELMDEDEATYFPYGYNTLSKVN